METELNTVVSLGRIILSSCGDDFLIKLPHDILGLGILIKLPAEDLIHLILVSKQFKALIRNSAFLEAHLSSIEEISPQYLQLLSYSNGEIRLYRSPNYSFNSIQAPFSPDFELVGNSARGVLCFRPDSSAYSSANLILWNPSILKFRLVPDTPINSRRHVYYGFGYDHVNMDFKVVQVSYNYQVDDGQELFHDHSEAMVYGVKSGCWRSVGSDVPCYVVLGHSSVTVNGIVYWLALHKSIDGDGKIIACVMGFDLANEVFKVVQLPPGYHPTNIWVYDVLHIRLSTSSDGKSLVGFFSDQLEAPVHCQFSKNWSVWYFIEDSIWEKRYDLVMDRQQCYYYCRPLYIVDDHGVVLAELKDGHKYLVNGLKEGEFVSDWTLLDHTKFKHHKSVEYYTGYTPTLAFLLRDTEQVVSRKKLQRFRSSPELIPAPKRSRH